MPEMSGQDLWLALGAPEVSEAEEVEMGRPKMFKVEISTSNAAFDDGMAEAEVARILRKVANQLEAGLHFYSDRDDDGVTLMDENGNTVGYAAFEAE